MNSLMESSFYRKEGTILWIMYTVFFLMGYWYGYDKSGWKFPLIMFIIMILSKLLFGKKHEKRNVV